MRTFHIAQYVVFTAGSRKEEKAIVIATGCTDTKDVAQATTVRALSDNRHVQIPSDNDCLELITDRRTVCRP